MRRRPGSAPTSTPLIVSLTASLRSDGMRILPTGIEENAPGPPQPPVGAHHEEDGRGHEEEEDVGAAGVEDIAKHGRQRGPSVLRLVDAGKQLSVAVQLHEVDAEHAAHDED